jgi:hypothetical protein
MTAQNVHAKHREQLRRDKAARKRARRQAPTREAWREAWTTGKREQQP